MVKMEKKKYRKPHMSEALLELSNLIGCTHVSTEGDALSRHGDGLDQTSSDEEAD